ncbi:hypothetical protein TorRG33x02_151250 [Trema orientale]|uniref:Uncharacterized protein n=1 Tax=Trema orientale TaxID=63057 RepID=A0A2P5EU22_TREOI|nr:hypothetical protein TorRG33x02_151250 [Trema orientale]
MSRILLAGSQCPIAPPLIGDERLRELLGRSRGRTTEQISHHWQKHMRAHTGLWCTCNGQWQARVMPSRSSGTPALAYGEATPILMRARARLQ